MVASPKVGAACAAAAAAASCAMFALAFEPYGVAELAYVFAIPAILACKAFFVENKFLREAEARLGASKSPAAKQLYAGIAKKFAPIKRAYLLASLAMSYAAWAWLLIWLRHVYPPAGWAAALALPLPIAVLFMFPWFAALPVVLPSSEESAISRIAKMAGLAGLWVALEWARSWFLTGFPWLPLGNSQWTRAAVMQSASWGGVWILSFTLVFFNLAIAEYLYKLYAIQRAKIKKLPLNYSKLTPEFYLALLLVMAGVWTYIAQMPREENARPLFKAGLVQPDFAGILKWSDELASENLKVISALSGALKAAGADVLLWPEAATPPRFPINCEPMKSWVELLSKKLQLPILTGNMFYDFQTRTAQNGAFFISETCGLSPEYYAKTHLVPFGEYVPKPFGFLGKVVPVGDMSAGSEIKPFPAKIKGAQYKMGAMICYEDVFPEIGRKMAKNGADIIFVCTNDSWYGTEAGAWQHASHSAIQAAATRKIILRSSNNGLSAVFDQYGRMMPVSVVRDADGKAWRGKGEYAAPLDIRNEFGRKLDGQTLKPQKCQPMLDERQSIYFRGCGVADAVAYENFKGESFYVRHGDWVVWASIAAAAAAAALAWAQRRAGAKKA